MIYTLENGRAITIPDSEIVNSMEILGISKQDAIQMWLEDNDYLTNIVVEELTAKAKNVKIQHEARAEKKKAQATKPRERKPDLEKESIIQILAETLTAQGFSTEITNKSKIITFTIGENHYKLDLIKQRPPK